MEDTMTVDYSALEGALRSAVVVDCEGKEVGEVLEVYPDPFSGRPGWVAVKGGLLHGKSLVPVGDCEPTDGRLQVPYDSATIRKAPYVDLSESGVVDEEAKRSGLDESIQDDRVATRPRDDHWEIYEYYGLPFGRPDTTGAASPEADYGFGSAGTSPEAEGALGDGPPAVTTDPATGEATAGTGTAAAYPAEPTGSTGSTGSTGPVGSTGSTGSGAHPVDEPNIGTTTERPTTG
jgi:PRC-barrel domain